MNIISNILADKKNQWAELIVSDGKNRFFGATSNFAGEKKHSYLENTNFHLAFLIEAIEENNTEIFIKYVQWVNTTSTFRNVPAQKIKNDLKVIDETARLLFPENIYWIINKYINKGIESLTKINYPVETYILQENPLYTEVKAFTRLLLSGKRKLALELVQKLVSDNTPIVSIYENIFKISQYEIGLLWQTNKITIAHEHFCSAAIQSIMPAIYGDIFSEERKGTKILACTIAGDLHEMGIRMLTDYFEMDGWDTYYLGANVPDDAIISATKEQKPDLLAISVSMSIHLGKAKRLIDKVRLDKDIKDVKIIVGGYPFIEMPTMAKKIGADGVALDGPGAIQLANELMLAANY